MSAPLSPRHEAFAVAYAADPVGARAAVAAGYTARSARTTAGRLLTNADILARVEQLRREAAEAHALTRERIVEGLLAEAHREPSEGGTHHGRIAAWVALARMHGFDAPPAAERDMTVNVRRIGWEDPVSRIVIVNAPGAPAESDTPVTRTNP